MALINTLQEFRNYVTVASNLLDEKFDKYTKQADRDLIRILGKDKFDEIVALPTDNEVRIFLCEYSANKGLSYALPSLVLNITNFGVFTTEVSEGKPAHWSQIKDLNRTLLLFAFNALDDAIKEVGVENIISLKGLFIKSLSEFEDFFSLAGSSQTFLSLVPLMREVQEQYIRAAIGDCYYYQFTDEQLKPIQGAIANLTVAKASVSGSFTIEPKGFLLRFEVLPWEKVEKTQQGVLEKFNEDRTAISMGYLNQIAKVLKSLPCYQPKEIESTIVRKKSGLYL